MNLILCWHLHQPTYQLDKWFDKAMHECYYSLLEATIRHGLKTCFHISGGLLQKMREKYPDFIERLRPLVNSGQVELLCSTYHQAILSMWGEDDLINQIRAHKSLIKEIFNYDARGMWVPERVWKPEFKSILLRADVDYVLLDEHLMYRADNSLWDVDKYHPHDNEGLTVFNIDKSMRYLVPFKSMIDVFDYLKKVNGHSDNRVLVNCADDAEKVGLWSNHGFAQDWIEKFYSSIANTDWINVTTYSEYLRYNPVDKKVVYAPGSYEEMESWSGGDFNNHLKHPLISPLYNRIKLARNWLKNNWADYYVSQCNDVFWSMNTLTYFRQMAYYHAIKSNAEVFPDLPKVEELDYNGDGIPEVILRNKNSQIIIEPQNGARIIEWDDFNSYYNLANTGITHWPYRRNSYSLYFLDKDFPGEAGTAPYDYKLVRNGVEFYYKMQGVFNGLVIKKRITTDRKSSFFDSRIELINEGDYDEVIQPGVEFVFTLPTFSTESSIMDFHKYAFEYDGRRVITRVDSGLDGGLISNPCVLDEFHKLVYGLKLRTQVVKHFRGVEGEGVKLMPVFEEDWLEVGKKRKIDFKFGGLKGSYDDFLRSG